MAHKNIVAVIRQGQVQKHTSFHYIDMELCDENLSQSIQRHRHGSEAPMTMPQVWRIMVDIASGLEFIHAKGEVHRDLKPANGIKWKR